MRTILIIIGLVLGLAQWSLAAPADTLAEAKQQIAKDRIVAADPLLQEVIDHPDATVAEVEEALLLQTMLYYGDVYGASLVLAPFTAASESHNELVGLTSRQLLAARRAFVVAGKRYLNTIFMGSELQTLQVTLPEFGDEDFLSIKAVLEDEGAVRKVVGGYTDDPSVGRGLLAKANRYGMYKGMASALGVSAEKTLGGLRGQVSNGVPFDVLAYLDWLASQSLDMKKLVNEPNGPGLVDLAKLCDEKIRSLAQNDPNNVYVKRAGQRAAQY